MSSKNSKRFSFKLQHLVSLVSIVLWTCCHYFFFLLLNSACVKFQINSMHSTVPERLQTLVLPLSLSPLPRLRHPLFFFFPLWSNITLALSKKFSPASKMSGQASLFLFFLSFTSVFSPSFSFTTLPLLIKKKGLNYALRWPVLQMFTASHRVAQMCPYEWMF